MPTESAEMKSRSLAEFTLSVVEGLGMTSSE